MLRNLPKKKKKKKKAPRLLDLISVLLATVYKPGGRMKEARKNGMKFPLPISENEKSKVAPLAHYSTTVLVFFTTVVWGNDGAMVRKLLFNGIHLKMDKLSKST